ncbi:MAG: tyrosine-type recombinase/integrase [Janthinobacterium lividum]
MAGKLTAVGVRALAKPGRYTDGEGLHLYVKDAERRAWVLRYSRSGKSRDMGLGAYPATSLAEARAKAAEARKHIRAGDDPLAVRDAVQGEKIAALHQTFRRAAEELIADKGKAWRNPKHRAQWASTLELYVYPVFGDWPTREVDSDAVMRVLRPLWDRAPETASRLRGRIEAVLDAAKARGWRDGENPARWKGHLASLLPPPRKVKATVHYPALPWSSLSEFVFELRQRSQSVAAQAVELVILTACRSGEVRGMQWGEIDWDASVWTIPGRRMKAGKPHRVPLSVDAMMLLTGRHPEPLPSATTLVFPGAKAGAALSDMSLTAVLRRMNTVAEGATPPWRDGATGEPITVHGFRSTFRVWAGELTSHPRELVEAALAHTLKDKVEAAYQRSDLMERRRPLMDEWASFCTTGKSNRMVEPVLAWGKKMIAD